MTPDREALIALASDVAAMRRAQRAFAATFLPTQFTDRQIAERQVDDAVSRILYERPRTPRPPDAPFPDPRD